MPRVYQDFSGQVDDVVELSEDASHHLMRVLRLGVGASVTVFNGKDIEYETKIIGQTKRNLQVQIISVLQQSRESPCRIHLYQAVSKGERMDFVVQKAVELGVAQITPLLTSRSVVKLNKQRWAKKQQHWQDIAKSACEQCGRNLIPIIHEVSQFHSAIMHSQEPIRFVLDPHQPTSLSTNHEETQSIALLIGPEGGFTRDEITCAIAKGFDCITLGPRVLRTETAALCAIALIQAKFGDIDF